MRPIFLFDLDETVIDSNHRQRHNADGSIDLKFWRRMNTPFNIARDSMLPLASTMIRAIAEGLDVGICTSRVMGKADTAWLDLRGMLPAFTLSRSIDDNRPAGEFKLAKMSELAVARRVSFDEIRRRVILWDDNADVQSTLKNAGFRVIDPVKYNLTQKEAI